MGMKKVDYNEKLYKTLEKHPEYKYIVEDLRKEREERIEMNNDISDMLPPSKTKDHVQIENLTKQVESLTTQVKELTECALKMEKLLKPKFDDLEKAEKIFKENMGRKFNMVISGVIKEYDSYNIREEQEEEWRRELKEEYITKMNSFDDLAYSVSCLYEISSCDEDFSWVKKLKIQLFESPDKVNTVRKVIISENLLEIIKKQLKYLEEDEIDSIVKTIMFIYNYILNLNEIEIEESLRLYNDRELLPSLRNRISRVMLEMLDIWEMIEIWKTEL